MSTSPEKCIEQNDLQELVQITNQADGSWENPIGVTITAYSEVYNEQRRDPVKKLVIIWVEQQERPSKEEAGNLNKELRTYYNKYDRLLITEQGLLAIKYFGESSQKYRTLICVPEELKKKTMVLKHDQAGHLGAVKTAIMTKQLFWWPDMTNQIELYVKACEQCFFHNDGFKPKPRMYMKLYEQKNIPNFRCYADTMGPITKESGVTKHIFLSTCAFTKFVTGAVLPNLKSSTIAKAFLQSHVLIHGVPEQVCTDQGSSIEGSEFIKEFYQLIGVTKLKTTPYHPRSNLVERANKTIKSILAKIVHDNPNAWDTQLQVAIFCYNNTVHMATGFEPSYLFLGRRVRSPSDLFFGTTTTEYYRNQGHYANEQY